MDAIGRAGTTPEAIPAPGKLIRQIRQAQRLTLTQLGKLTGYSAAQVSRYERGISSMTDVAVLRCFAEALGIPPQAFGLASPRPKVRHGQPTVPTTAYPSLPARKVDRTQREDGEDPVRRRNLLANLAVTAAAAASSRFLGGGAAQADEALLGEVLVAGLRDAMLGLGSNLGDLPPEQLPAELSRALTDFHTCRYGSLAVRLPRLIRTGHALNGGRDHAFLAQSYVLATRMLVKLDEQQLGWMAADRARQLAEAGDDALTVAEAARNLAVLARKAGWNDQAMSIALAAADDPGLRSAGRAGAAERGLLIQSAAYTAARSGDRKGMRQLTDEAAAIATELGGSTMLRDHGGGFSPITVQLHLISAENSAGDPAAALSAARAIAPQSLPSVERRSRYYTDIAAAFGQLGRREECVRALLTAEHHAPEETHARPAVKSLISGLLVSGRTAPELRGLAARSGVLA
ncbi:transcriptional regulator with XRE-family HTH domain [Streptosporangium album]|uniref:Transcriptional regulator with XRE-family HTH domain n=1 Tax=Streptosporangium album TaxID=47479 RepID=A0A7W7WB71_9ACTN|nr:helix-turn-helix transcriptional regulator [Streptosporangium album]MBB4940771.1 transcriptional regulator with XRE-family HTH domain [Streptosporangium album]